MNNILKVFILSIFLIQDASAIGGRAKDLNKLQTQFSSGNSDLANAEGIDSTTVWTCKSYSFEIGEKVKSHDAYFSRLDNGWVEKRRVGGAGTDFGNYFFNQDLGEWEKHTTLAVNYLRRAGKDLILEWLMTPDFFDLTWQVLCDASERKCVKMKSIIDPDQYTDGYVKCVVKNRDQK